MEPKRAIRRLVLVLLVGVGLVVPGRLDPGTEAATADDGPFRSALQAAAAGDGTTALSRADRLSDPLARALVVWRAAREADNGLSFATHTRLLRAHPTWPSRTLIRRRGEEALDAATPDADVLAWFDAEPPLTTAGRIRYAAALDAAGRGDDLTRHVRATWRDDTSLAGADEAAFLATYGERLAAADHAARLDALLWEGKSGSAALLLERVTADERRLAEARIGLRARTLTPEAARSMLPLESARAPALVYETARWLNETGAGNAALRVLADHRGPVPEPQRWWPLRARVAREALSMGDASTAYQAVVRHGLPVGADFAEAEWLAGWIALRFLGQPDIAAGHFHNLYEGVRLPISRARGAYWAGRAHHDSGRPTTGDDWYRRAADHPTTYYGQLAQLARTGGDRALRLPADPVVSNEQRQRLSAHPLLRPIRLLAAADEPAILHVWLTALASTDAAPGWKQAVAELGRELDRPELMVAVAKSATANDVTLIANGYPIVPLPSTDGTDGGDVERALVLAIIRQESTFNRDAVSRAGARGLMQLMPATARQVASRHGFVYEASLLTEQPIYNIQLGTLYLGQLLQRTEGAYVYSVAGYNAGPGRVATWRQQYGDPRGDLYRMIDWIEAIPFAETRNYVQRTLENLQVYRARLGDADHALRLDRDLTR